MKRVIAFLLLAIVFVLSACQSSPKASAECISAKDVMRHLNETGCVWGTVENVVLTPELKTTGVYLSEGPFTALAIGVAVSSDLKGKCVEVRGKILGKAGDGSRLSILVDTPNQIKVCSQ